MPHVDLIDNREYKFFRYVDQIIASTRVTMVKPLFGSCTCQIVFDVNKTKNGVDNKGSRASAFWEALVISDKTRESNAALPCVNSKDVIDTPFGRYSIETDNTGYILVRELLDEKEQGG
jgi:hypothetical protein